MAKDEVNRMSDLIDRQAAIDEANAWLLDCLKVNKQDRSCGLIRRLEDLPSAQPDIVRCKDCKHWIPYDWMFSEVWQSRNIADYPEDEIGCKYCDMSMKADDYCSRAERREVTE